MNKILIGRKYPCNACKNHIMEVFIDEDGDKMFICKNCQIWSVPIEYWNEEYVILA
jgi:hypothetical protein